MTAWRSNCSSYIHEFSSQELLLMEKLRPHKDKPKDPDLALEVTNATFAWDKEQAVTPDDKKGAESKDKKAESNPKVGSDAVGVESNAMGAELSTEEAESGSKKETGEDATDMKSTRAEEEGEAALPLLDSGKDEEIVKTLFGVSLNVEKVRWEVVHNSHRFKSSKTGRRLISFNA